MTLCSDAMDLLRQAADCHVMLRADGHAIRYKPIDRLPDDLAWKIAGSKNAVLNALATPLGQVISSLAPIRDRALRQDLMDLFDESAATFEFEQGHDRHMAEWLAWAMVWAECERRYDRARATVEELERQRAKREAALSERAA